MRDVKEVRAPTAPVVVQTIGDHMYDPLDQRELQDEQSWVPPTESEEHTQGQRPPFESGSLSERIAQVCSIESHDLRCSPKICSIFAFGFLMGLYLLHLVSKGCRILLNDYTSHLNPPIYILHPGYGILRRGRITLPVYSVVLWVYLVLSPELSSAYL